ncbi:hypothetical protein DFH06DRAFT_1319397 [Mycena polygramma]|nr:hypothetical protein DFH06DRAFT_1319397 [Mycena polygramma]
MSELLLVGTWRRNALVRTNEVHRPMGLTPRGGAALRGRCGEGMGRCALAATAASAGAGASDHENRSEVNAYVTEGLNVGWRVCAQDLRTADVWDCTSDPSPPLTTTLFAGAKSPPQIDPSRLGAPYSSRQGRTALAPALVSICISSLTSDSSSTIIIYVPITLLLPLTASIIHTFSSWTRRPRQQILLHTSVEVVWCFSPLRPVAALMGGAKRLGYGPRPQTVM